MMTDDALSHAEWMVTYWRKQANAQAPNIAEGNLMALGMANTYRECSNMLAHLILGASDDDDAQPFPTSALWSKGEPPEDWDYPPDARRRRALAGDDQALDAEYREDIASGNVWPEGPATFPEAVVFDDLGEPRNAS